MRRATRSLVAAAVLVALPSVAAAGWRSSDRRQLEDDVAVEEPYERSDQAPPPGDAHGARPLHRPVERVHRTAPMPATRPYWGTMRPYWNAPEPPGVIHRQPRTAPLESGKTR